MEKELQKINSKLNVLIGILLDIKDQNSGTKTAEKNMFKKLSDLGMENADIGVIFNKTPEQVSKQLYETKRTKKNREKKNG